MKKPLLIYSFLSICIITSFTLLFKVISVIHDPLSMQENLRTLVQSIFQWTDQHSESHVL